MGQVICMQKFLATELQLEKIRKSMYDNTRSIIAEFRELIGFNDKLQDGEYLNMTLRIMKNWCSDHTIKKAVNDFMRRLTTKNVEQFNSGVGKFEHIGGKASCMKLRVYEIMEVWTIRGMCGKWLA
ncbi:uncharacterized protein LOC112494249 isoform X2 [Cephus cinctus]|uniref:Uncharacterized protein LOC112494249 isoform X2 n=1 Tax=Cephus cinctus TaxID=211228 RepID=A0AAJ7RFR8_CEPCN|nr:uncharacterized protein LOC112494249 isoform X2 [Cephus cinctus]